MESLLIRTVIALWRNFSEVATAVVPQPLLSFSRHQLVQFVTISNADNRCGQIGGHSILECEETASSVEIQTSTHDQDLL